VDISGLDKAEVLAALYNHANPQGRGLLKFDSNSMTVEEARQILASGQICFDYLRGRVMKIDLSKKFLDTRLYDRDNGPFAAENAILEELTKPS
jgi:hypothetical protein